MKEAFIIGPRGRGTEAGKIDLRSAASYRLCARNFRNFNELQEEIKER
ncbi:MAG: hypothetical protein R3286_08365 [Gammaproteobacteria bacterium]|nr:hypothetical protein [Gammaproteobacteria bacterium]